MSVEIKWEQAKEFKGRSKLEVKKKLDERSG